jgi:hypothetical protein
MGAGSASADAAGRKRRTTTRFLYFANEDRRERSPRAMS